MYVTRESISSYFSYFSLLLLRLIRVALRFQFHLSRVVVHLLLLPFLFFRSFVHSFFDCICHCACALRVYRNCHDVHSDRNVFSSNRWSSNEAELKQNNNKNFCSAKEASSASLRVNFCTWRTSCPYVSFVINKYITDLCTQKKNEENK